MPVTIDITDEDISYAEEVLLSPGKHFDSERREFIRCLRTIDLQAVPGSGKTTALLAKLLILERHLPFADGPGILVISHTNAAVDEIKNRIGLHCRRLLSYPNFVGTIQSFVDAFLGIPSFVNFMKFRPSRIDAEAYEAEIEHYYAKMPDSPAKAWLNSRSDPVHFLKNLRFDLDLNLTDGIGGEVTLKSESGTPSYATIARVKKQIFKKGLLHFEDAFFFACLLLSKFPIAKALLRARFAIVLVDEMQDMSKHQHDLLEQLFMDGAGRDGTVIQRIGDKNQAIFGGKNISYEGVWTDRDEILTFQNSQRLSNLNTAVLAPFALYGGDGFVINGLCPANIKPHMFVYDDDTITDVVGRFAELIKLLCEQGRIQPEVPRTFKAVSWSASWEKPPSPDEGRLRLVDFCPTFQVALHQKNQDFETLADYLVGIITKDQTLSTARKSILNGILRVFRIEEVLDPRKLRPFSATSLLSYFREHKPSWYDRLNLLLFQWSVALVSGQVEMPLNGVRRVLPKLLEHFGKYVSTSSDFINASASMKPLNSSLEGSSINTLKFGDIEVGLGTVHSVKGQTHTATLYFESYYHRDGIGASSKSYESQRLAEQFKGTFVTSAIGSRAKESAKMIFVGFSRPTHLLCFAVHKTRFARYLADVDPAKWEIITV